MLLLVAQSAGAGKTPVGEEGARDRAAPPFTLAQMGGEELSLEDLNGRIVVLDFWATWCRPCRALLHTLDELRRRAEFDEVVFLAINVDEEKRSQAEEVFRQLDVDLPLLWGDRKVMRRYWIKALPTTFVIDREGRLRSRHTGGDKKSRDSIAASLRGILEER